MISRRVTLVRYFEMRAGSATRVLGKASAGSISSTWNVPFQEKAKITRVKGRDIHDDSIQYIRHLSDLDRAHCRARRLPPAH
jgi:hypothetical protein